MKRHSTKIAAIAAVSAMLLSLSACSKEPSKDSTCGDWQKFDKSAREKVAAQIITDAGYKPGTIKNKALATAITGACKVAGSGQKIGDLSNLQRLLG